MKLNWVMIAAALVGSTLCLPAHAAGSCPQGYVERCPNYEKGEVGPCQCKAGQGGLKGSPQTIVNNTNAARVPPPDRLSPDLQRRLEGRMRTSNNLKQMALAAKPDEPNKYVCEGVTCTCAGAYDCVKMISADGKCKDGEGHTQCNDSGCSCDAK
jgi:hypothetical protein